MSTVALDGDDNLNRKLQKAFKETESKLGQYYATDDYPQPPRRQRYTQHALPLLKAARWLDPRRAAFTSETAALEELRHIPGFGDNAALEFKLFKAQCKDVAEEVQIIPYWRALVSRYPTLSCLALRYLSVPVGSVDAERSFSSRGCILTSRRMKLTKANRARLTFLFVNNSEH